MVTVNKKENTVLIDIEIFLINRSQHPLNLFILAAAIKKQIENVYNGKFGGLELKTVVTVKPLYKFSFRAIYNKMVIAISPYITNDNVAEADFSGLLIKLNPKHINSIISGTNKRTVPHELGHLLGLDHPHANAAFESVNLKAAMLEQGISNEEKTINLMCQSWYIQKAGINLNNALTLTENQLKLIYENYNSKKLNRNYSIVKGFFNYKWVGKV
ncbi:MAG: hypothetical protein H0W73_15775 [Bacteroidetes bacterium]|nr:hypothetical protein [Bacteroidota bacterium]